MTFYSAVLRPMMFARSLSDVVSIPGLLPGGSITNVKVSEKQNACPIVMVRR